MTRGVHLLIEGRVQGVGFRYFTARAARELGVRGWVRNLRDGRVEAMAVAEAGAIDRLLARLQEGPTGGRVDRLEVREAEGEERMVRDFEIRG